MKATSSKSAVRGSLTPECPGKPPVTDDNAQTILHSQVNAGGEHIQLLISTIDRLSEHLELDGQLSALQLARAAILEEAQVRTHDQQVSKSADELKDLQQQVYSLTGQCTYPLHTSSNLMSHMS